MYQVEIEIDASFCLTVPDISYQRWNRAALYIAIPILCPHFENGLAATLSCLVSPLLAVCELPECYK